MRRITTIGFLFAGVVGPLGCAVTAEDEPSSGLVQQVTEHNGISLNGISLNGISLNGISLNGVSLNGISLNGTSLSGLPLDGATLNGGAADPSTLVGSTWIGTLSNGGTLAMRIDAAHRGTEPNADLGLYDVSYQVASGWLPLCGLQAGAPVAAIGVPGTWNQAQGVVGGGAYTASTTQFSWACRGTSVAKCVELGYKPWTDRATHMASCVRLLRADYCGDGTPHTLDGQLVNLYDNVGIQADTERWSVEAEWTPAGARCLTRQGMTRFREFGLPPPPCAPALARRPSCGTFRYGAVLIDEIPTAAR